MTWLKNLWNRLFGIAPVTKPAVKPVEPGYVNYPLPPSEPPPSVGTSVYCGPMRTAGAPLLCIPEKNAIQGIDVSHYQPRVKWEKVVDKGFKFCFAKAGDGNSAEATPMFHTHRTNAKNHGLVFGSYFFYRFGKFTPKEQAEVFFRNTGGVWDGELPMVGDFEWNKGTKYAEGNTMDDAAAKEALEFMERLEQLSLVTPILYTSFPFFKGFKNPERFFRFHPWCPAYGPVPGPRVPLPWSRWAFWQYADQPPFAREITGDPHLDLNYFNGSIEQLNAMRKK